MRKESGLNCIIPYAKMVCKIKIYLLYANGAENVHPYEFRDLEKYEQLPFSLKAIGKK